MSHFPNRKTTHFLHCGTAFLLTALAISHAHSQAPFFGGSRAAPASAFGLVSFPVQMPNGTTRLVKLRRLSPAAVRQIRPAGPLDAGPLPLVTNYAQLYNSALNYSRFNYPQVNSADNGWIFPTRGYDLRNRPTTFRKDLHSLIYPADAPYTNNFGAAIELLQMGQSAQISSLQVGIGTFREKMVGGTISMDYTTSGSVAVILFWDSVYNDPVNGLPRDSSGAYKLANDGNGASGVLVPLSAGFHQYTFNFENDGGTSGRFNITDYKGRMGMTIAAVYDANAGLDGNGNPISTREDAVYLQPGAMVGQNKYFLISHGNFNISNPAYTGTTMAATTDSFTLPNNGAILGNSTTYSLDGSIAYQAAPSDGNFNPGEGTQVTGSSGTGLEQIYAPANSSFVLYGTKLDGSNAVVGELRGRVRQQGLDPDSVFNPTQVISPYDPTPAMPSLPKVPGESRMNRFRFTFISPVLPPAFNVHTFYNPATQVPAGYTYFQQETYAMPSYGDNADYDPNAMSKGTPLKYNYRLRGIPAGTYSVLVQALPVVDMVSAGPISSMVTPPAQYPGSDYVPYFVPSLTISESTFPIDGNTANLSYDNYSNPTVLDIKLHRPADVTGGDNLSDGMVDTLDFNELIGEFGNGPLIPNTLLYNASKFDVTGNGLNMIPDGYVDTLDFNVLVSDFGNGVPDPFHY